MSTLAREMPESPSPLPNFDGRTRIGRAVRARRVEFDHDPAAFLQEDLIRAYLGLTVWRETRERRLRVRKPSLDWDRVYVGGFNTWLGLHRQVSAFVATGNGHGQDLASLIAQELREEHGA